MAKVSIIIPARNEKYLKRTIQDIYEKATGECELIVGFNGKPYEDLSMCKGLRVFESPENIGLKPMINKLAQMATGKYIYKTDAHCSFSKGFDEILKADMQDDWVVTPRFYVLNADIWGWQDDRFYDYFYLCCPFSDPKGLRFKAGGHWPERTKARDFSNYPQVDETPQMHGSGWFVNRNYFLNVLHGFPEDDPDGHAQEPINLSLKNYLKGGQTMVNKRTWYAHLHQRGDKRGYPEDKTHTERTYNETAKYWLLDKEPNLLHNFEWFISEKFPNMPTWPENSIELLRKFQEDNK